MLGVTATLLSGAAFAYWDVYIMGRTEPLFGNAPIDTFELELVVAGGLSAIFAILFLAGVISGSRKGYTGWPARRWRITFALGVVEVFSILILLNTLPDKTGPYQAVAYGWMFGFPLVCTFPFRSSPTAA